MVFQLNKLVLMYILKFINIRKSVNFCFAVVSYAFSRLIKKDFYLGYPSFISIEISSVCNLSCPQCMKGNNNISRVQNFFDFNIYKKLLEVNGKYLLNTILYFQGEPLMNKNFFDFVTEAGKYNIYTQTSTNGQLITDEIAKKLVLSKLDRIIISIDGTTQNSYSKYRVGGKLDKVIAAIDNIVSAKKKFNSKFPKIEAQFIVFNFNENEIDDFKNLCKIHHVDICSIKSAQLLDPNNDFYLLPKNEKYRRYKKENGVWITKKDIHHLCFRAWSGAVISSDGNVVPCCFDKNCNFVFGNISDPVYNYNLKKIMKCEKAINFRKRLMDNRTSIDICNNCNE